MEVILPLHASAVNGTMADVRACLAEAYSSGMVRYFEADDESGFLSAGSMTGRDDMAVSVYGNDERMMLVSRFDNLGKGASGAAIQNMNITLGVPEDTGLVTGGN